MDDEFWEAWEFTGRRYVPPKEDPHPYPAPIDAWRYDGRADCTFAHFEWKSRVAYYRGFKPREHGFQYDDQNGTLIKRSGVTLNEGKQVRWYNIGYSCCQTAKGKIVLASWNYPDPFKRFKWTSKPGNECPDTDPWS
ncbi:MAG: hypothetical protein HZC36_09920 [Armatimonadetes bacterium]|nr:hypothetical protein [Armatimonadota bacterium]